VTNDAEVRRSLRNGVPDATAQFLGELLSDDQIARLFGKSGRWRESSRALWVSALRKCELAAETRDRSAQLYRCLGERRDFGYENLTGLRLARLMLQGLSFVGAEFRDTAFQSCEFADCDFSGAQLRGARMFDCVADERTAAGLEGAGIPRGEVTKKFLRERAVAIETDDPVVELVARFFRRFIRKELGRHQATAAERSLLAGLGGEERKFTEREIIPEMRRAGVIAEGGVTGAAVAVFNPVWQPEGDAIVGTRTVTDRLSPIVDRLRASASRYSIL
jgi:hypothetical protein